jgi:regulator of protease activity HflC (stomatin/prohibitin superfamily)
LVVRLGQPVRIITEPGLNAKIPFIDAVIYIDKRILNIESPAQEVIASSQDRSNAGVPRAAQAGERQVLKTDFFLLALPFVGQVPATVGPVQ